MYDINVLLTLNLCIQIWVWNLKQGDQLSALIVLEIQIVQNVLVHRVVANVSTLVVNVTQNLIFLKIFVFMHPQVK